MHFACPTHILDALPTTPERNYAIRARLEAYRLSHSKASRVNVFKPLYEIERLQTTPRPRLRRPPAPTLYIIGNIPNLPSMDEPRQRNQRILEHLSGMSKPTKKKTCFKIERHEKGLGPIVSINLSPELIDWLPQTSRERSEFIRFILQQITS